jgi:hypothetical protein
MMDKHQKSLLIKPGTPSSEPCRNYEQEALHIDVQAVMQRRSKRRDQDPEKDRPLTPHFIVCVARVLAVAKVHSFTDICALGVKVETYRAPKGPLQFRRCQRFGHAQLNCGCAPTCVTCGEAHPSGSCATSKQQLRGYPHCQPSRLQ